MVSSMPNLPKFLRRKAGEAPKEFPKSWETSAPKAPPIKAEKLDKRTPYQRTVDAANAHIAIFEEKVDAIWDGDVDFSFYDYFNLNVIGRPQVKVIHDYYLPLQAEVNAIATDDDLAEAYSCYSKADIKRAQNFINGLIADCEIWMKNKKRRRIIKRKRTRSKEKIVSKVKYQKDASELKLVSVDPVNIVGAREVWIFNTKYNTIGKYVSERREGLEIKGSTIKGFDKEESAKKRLRGPAIEKITQACLTGSKPDLRKLLDTIKTKPGKLNGRLNENTIILRCLK